MTEWETQEFFSWIEEHDRHREQIDSFNRKSRTIATQMNDMSPVQRDALRLQLAFAPGLTTAQF